MTLRVLHVIGGLGAGGAEALLYRLATRESDVDHEVISLRGPDWYSPMFAERGITVHHLGISGPADAVTALSRLRRLIMNSGADVVQTWMYRANLFAGAVARAAGKPVVWGIHTGSLEPLRFAQRLWVYAGGIAARFVPSFIINCSKHSAQVHAKLGYSAVPGAVIANGYDPGVFFPEPEARKRIRGELGLEPGVFTLGFIRRWAPAKDIPTLVKALRLAREQGIPFRTVFAGSDLDQGNADLAELLDKEGCAEITTLLGRRPDIPDIARAVDLHLLSSLVEAFPNIVGETMLAGTPNVVTNVGDCATMVGDSGWVVPTASPEKIAAAIAEAYNEWKEHPADWRARQEKARELIASRFTFERMAGEYERVWRELAENK